MKNLILIACVVGSCASYGGEPFVKDYFKSKNWTVIQAGITGESSQCALRSSMHYLDKGRNPLFGTTSLEVSHPSNNITLTAANIGAYFKISRKITIHVDGGVGVPIRLDSPMLGKGIVDQMLKGKAARVEVDFGSGDPPSVHTFPLAGFNEAYSRMPACAKNVLRSKT